MLAAAVPAPARRARAPAQPRFAVVVDAHALFGGEGALGVGGGGAAGVALWEGRAELGEEGEAADDAVGAGFLLEFLVVCGGLLLLLRGVGG